MRERESVSELAKYSQHFFYFTFNQHFKKQNSLMKLSAILGKKYLSSL
jgi:hypothetical protein